MLSVGGVAWLSLMAVNAVPMRLIRRNYGRGIYWVSHLAVAGAMIAAGLPMQAGAFLLVALMMGAYAEVETHTNSVFSAGTVAVSIAVGAGIVALASIQRFSKLNVVSAIRAELETFITQLQAVHPQTSANVDSLMQQLPSAVIVLLVLALAAGLIWEKRASVWAKLPWLEKTPPNLRTFSVPDIFVWLTMAAVLGSFLQHGTPLIETLSLNMINLVVVLYFFQGIVVVSHLFEVFKVSPLWQAIWYVLIVVQLFLIVSIIGFADFWIDFRRRLAKKTTEINKGF
jgi:hypothetical protein